ncbi:hypothetical protein [Kribbella sp. CA-294648]|uniref:hypothetical protein n=1 Tax=Kribbella sp. CA-294648 TaxID=3239948 RepID=UPI003D9184EE
MTSDPYEPLDRPILDTERRDDAPEADVLEQLLGPLDDQDAVEDFEVPAEADPADVADQHRLAGEDDDGDYRQ